VDLEPVTRFEWERLVRRARLGSVTQHIALLLGTYASRDGTNVRPGVKRLALVSDYDARTIKRALVKLRRLGLIERIEERFAKGRNGGNDVYRLTFPGDLAERITVLDPPEERVSPVSLDPAGVIHNQVTGESPVPAEPAEERVTRVTGTGDRNGQFLTPPTPPLDQNNHHPYTEVLELSGDRGSACGQPRGQEPIGAAAWEAVERARRERQETQ
jgi:hypothetical protein